MTEENARKKLSLKTAPVPETPALSNQELAALRDLEGKAQKRQSVLDMIVYLETTYPQCFNRTAPKPLKLGMAEDLFGMPELLNSSSKAIIRDALKLYTLRRKYQKAIVKGQARYDLTGQESGQVDPSHKATAQEWLDANPKKK